MKRVVAILLLVAFCCGFIPQQVAVRQNSQLATERYTEAIKSVSIHRDSLKAVALLEQVLELDSMHAPALALLSQLSRDNDSRTKYARRAYQTDTANLHYVKLYQEALIDANDYQPAIPLSFRIVERSTEPRDYYVLSVLLDGSSRQEEAIAVLDTAYTRLGWVAPLSRLRLQLLMKAGRNEEAENEAKRGVESEPHNAESYVALAEFYANTQRDSLAMSAYQRGMTVDGWNLDLLVSFSDFYLQRNQTEEGLHLLNRVFSHERVDANQKISLWKTLTKNVAGYRRFLEHYDNIAKLLYTQYPNNRDVARLYIDHLIAVGNVEQVISCAKELVLNTKKPVVEDYLLVISGESHLEHPDSVKKYINLALQHFPNNVQLLQGRAYIAMDGKEYKEALNWMQLALENADTDAARSEIWGTIGDMEEARGKRAQSYKAYDKALQYDANNSLVLNNYAYHLSLEGRNLERALTMATRAIALSERNPTYLDTMAWVLYKLGRYDEAKKYQQQALSLDREKSPELALHYGDILYALGDKFMAEVYWRKALERGYDAKEIEARFQISKQQ